MSKLLLYCNKAKPYLYDLRNVMGIFGGYNVKQTHLDLLLLNGKIVAECDFEVEEIDFASERFYENDIEKYNIEINKQNELLKRSCLTATQIVCYLDKKGKEQTNLKGYAIHIKNLHIFDKPRELSDFNKIIETTYGEEPDATITRAPQNMMRCCYEKKPKEWETGVLISIRPEWLCKILNGEKTIEVRRKVLKEMLENE